MSTMPLLSAHAAIDTPYVLADLDTGEILAANRADDRWYPASLTKLMTAYVTFRAIADGRLEDGSPVIISKQAARQPPSKMGYKAGSRLRIDTALKIVIIKSANDVSQALAEAVAGSLPAFVDRMNEQARRLGLTNTRFANANGLHSKDQYSSARDMAVLTRQIQNEFPQYAKWFSSPAIKTKKRTYYSYNLLLERFPGTTGMKTGFVCASGYNLVATAKRNGQNLVAVVMGTGSQTERAVSAAKLLLDGFSGKAAPNGRTLAQPASSGAAPKNMRPILCTEAARKARYDPAAETAVIDSPFLEARRQTRDPLVIALGGVDADPSPAFAARAFSPRGKVPVPQKRPQYTRLDVDGTEITNSSPASTELSGQLRGGLPIPMPRPTFRPDQQAGATQ